MGFQGSELINWHFKKFPVASVERTVRGRGEGSRSPMRRQLWVEDGGAWTKAGAMNWREVGRFRSYV